MKDGACYGLTPVIAHNLVRLVMQEAALVWSVPLQRISFKGALDTFREYLSAAGSRCQRHHLRRLYSQLLSAIAAGRVPSRPELLSDVVANALGASTRQARDPTMTHSGAGSSRMVASALFENRTSPAT